MRIFENHSSIAIIISILINIMVSIAGVVPSVFVTAANLIFFGFWQGTIISFIGETIGALIAFYLYRKGFKRISHEMLKGHPRVNSLMHLDGKDAFLLILSLRIMPFIPSGIVTFFSAIGSVSILVFFLGSTIGKLPAMLMESYAVYQVTTVSVQGKIILSLAACYGIFICYKKIKKKK
nr:VTT domain-containing protein [Metabacillus dongyingensis]